MILFYLRITVDGSTDEFAVCDEHGDLLDSVADDFIHEMVETRQKVWRAMTHDAPCVDFWEWLANQPISEWCPAPHDRDPDQLYGPFNVVQLVTLASKYNPQPWNGHPAYEG